MKLRLIEHELQHLKDNGISVDKVRNFIKENCQPFLLEGVTKPLYRGTSGSSGWAFIKPIRSDRMPLDTSTRVTKMVNNAIISQNLVANRTNSVFCTGNADEAAVYGDVFCVIPIGKFSYTWSPDIQDLTNDLRSFLKDTDDLDEIKRVINGLDFRGDDGSLDDAVNSHNEVMIQAQSVLYIEPEYYSRVMDL